VINADGITFTGEYLVLAMGTEPNFLQHPGADDHAFPLYSVDDAERLRSRLLTVFEDAHRNSSLIDRGAMNFVIVGAGATGVEIAGALADAIDHLIPARVRDAKLGRAEIHLVDPAPVVLAPFSERAHAYARRVLEQRGVNGIKAAGLAARSGLPQAHSGRLEIGADLAVPAFPGVYALGDVANTLAPDGSPFPQLGSVALLAGRQQHPRRHRWEAALDVPLPRPSTRVVSPPAIS
jgi:NADH dehydrogenase